MFSKYHNRGLLWLILCTVPLLAVGEDQAARVVILANSKQPDSVRLAEFYAAQRGVPPENIVALPLPEEESVTWRQFIDQVYQPVQDELYRRGWITGLPGSRVDRYGRKAWAFSGHNISYLVTCRGVPLRIYNDPTLLGEKPPDSTREIFNKNEAAVDAELSRLAESGGEITAYVPNPFFDTENFSLEQDFVIKVSRLDGPSFESARQLVLSALRAEKQGVLGRYYIDTKGGPNAEGDRWLEATRDQLAALGFDGDEEATAATLGAASRFDAPAFYFGWYRGDFNGPMAAPGFVFPPGAIALHIHSFSAQTLHSATQSWCGPLVAHGVTATLGNVFEPYLGFTHRPDLLLRALAQGKTWGDAVYYALPVLSWQAVAIGDPLYCPFKVSLEAEEQELGSLPPALAPYVLMRRANLLVREGRTAEALTLLRNGLRTQPSLVLGLALARLAAAEQQPSVVASALGFAPLLKKFSTGDWPLARAAAGLLAAHGAAKEALQVYATLAAQRAPTSDDYKALLQEARNTADAAHDLKLSLHFAQLLNEQATVRP